MKWTSVNVAKIQPSQYETSCSTHLTGCSPRLDFFVVFCILPQQFFHFANTALANLLPKDRRLSLCSLQSNGAWFAWKEREKKGKLLFLCGKSKALKNSLFAVSAADNIELKKTCNNLACCCVCVCTHWVESVGIKVIMLLINVALWLFSQQHSLWDEFTYLSKTWLKATTGLTLFCTIGFVLFVI